MYFRRASEFVSFEELGLYPLTLCTELENHGFEVDSVILAVRNGVTDIINYLSANNEYDENQLQAFTVAIDDSYPITSPSYVYEFIDHKIVYTVTNNNLIRTDIKNFKHLCIADYYMQVIGASGFESVNGFIASNTMFSSNQQYEEFVDFTPSQIKAYLDLFGEVLSSLQFQVVRSDICGKSSSFSAIEFELLQSAITNMIAKREYLLPRMEVILMEGAI